ncbi:hypothetical protein [Agarivorans sp. 1_MG-2023]|uniref:hypothetical protein n=1 Tax=Agarivorans sp. 1_MG-2023 TaxID=3062634 RepID=UPI0026E27FE4|nr:hypothetical protein [Agarivorans sp. 1_MG-2023]MDO6764287.1 hypothetical protein [Agarivorans sp. 1_MG-2023]
MRDKKKNSLFKQGVYPLYKQLDEQEATMESKVDWFLKAVRISSAWNPIAAVFLQLQSEIDGIEISRRLNNLEDPISSNCENFSELGKAIYEQLKNEKLGLTQDIYIRYARPLALFESEGYLQRRMVMGSPYALGIELFDPTFTLYLARLFENQSNMSELYSLVDSCNIGVTIGGIQLANSLAIPLDVVRAVFSIYVAKSFGLLSNERGTCNYRGVA